MLATKEERIAHLLRRFGWGAHERDLKNFKDLTEDQAIESILSCAKDPEAPAVRFAFREKEDATPFSGYFRGHWIYAMIAQRNPLRERLAIFWHDHFAVSDNKVEDGMMMLQYLDEIRRDPAGKFADILERVVTTPAFLKYLDVKSMIKSSPNENFARELFELYTLGIGNYIEKDIKEASRALTGWSWINTYYEFQGTNSERLKGMIKYDRPFSAYAYVPTFHDETPKTILGKTANFDGHTLLQTVAKEKRCAEFICTKLWEHFVYAGPEPGVVKALTAAYDKSGGEIRSVLRAMTKTSEFWSDKAIGKRVKSPYDLMIGLCRAQGVDNGLRDLFKPGEAVDKPVPQEVIDATGGIGYWGFQMGMDLLFPADVSGWEWGEGWISTNTMPKRVQFAGVLNWKMEKKDYYVPYYGTLPLIAYMLKANAQSADEFTKAFLTFHDANLSPESTAVIRDHFEKRNWKATLPDPRNIGWMLTEATKLMVAAPGYHLH